MKRFFIKICFLIITILFSVNTFAVASHDPSRLNDFDLYKNNQYNFQIPYPVEWDSIEGDQGSVVTFFSPLKKDLTKYCENVSVYVQDLTAYPDITLDKYTELNLTQVQNLTDFKLIKRENNVINGVDAKIFVYTSREKNVKFKEMEVCMIANNKGYVIIFSAEENQYSKCEGIAKDIVYSILFFRN